MNHGSKHILLIEDNPGDADLIACGWWRLTPTFEFPA